MSLELISALASVVTALVIGATAIAAVIQLRHMRMSNQITALLAVQNELDAKDFRDADVLIRNEFPEILDNAGFCEYCMAFGRGKPPLEQRRYLEARLAARLIANTYENLGVLVKRGIVDRDLFLDVYSWLIAAAWGDLTGFVAIARVATGEQTIFENFEFIASISRDCLAAHPVNYPSGTKRLDPQLPEAAKKSPQ